MARICVAENETCDMLMEKGVVIWQRKRDSCMSTKRGQSIIRGKRDILLII